MKYLFYLSLIACSLQVQGQRPEIPLKPEVIFVQGGTFSMGSNSEPDEKPIHQVTVSSFSIGKYEVTNAQYAAFCEDTGRPLPEAPSWGVNPRAPVVNVNYNDAVSYCNWLGEVHGGNWRLPTEAEWEYAACGGQKSTKTSYSGGNDLDKVGWFADNSGGQTQSVGRKAPNELGIYDMSGNVWEWCRDWYDEEYYANSPSSNPRGPTSGSYRVIRGGSWRGTSSRCRVANRYGYSPDSRNDYYGFRVVLSQ